MAALNLRAVCWTVGVLLFFIDKKSVAAGNVQQNTGECQQHPRFLAARKGSTVKFFCSCGSLCAQHDVKGVEWFRGTQNGSLLEAVTDDRKRRGKNFNPANNSIITIPKIQLSDNGIYYCKFQTEKGELTPFCGTELRVLGFGTPESLKTKSTLKDAIIMIQTILIVVFIAVPMLLIIDKNNRPVQHDEDHTYEGLKIEETATYEDIIAYQVPDGKWRVGEHPCME